MTEMKIGTKVHPKDIELADYLDKSLSEKDRLRIEEHVAGCGECLERIVLAYESVEDAGAKKSILRQKLRIDAEPAEASTKKGRLKFMKKINIYLILAIISFTLSFAIQRYFLQFLVATLLLGIKWVADSKSTKMLIMIYEAWQKGGEKEASRVIEALDLDKKRRF